MIVSSSGKQMRFKCQHQIFINAILRAHTLQRLISTHFRSSLSLRSAVEYERCQVWDLSDCWTLTRGIHSPAIIATNACSRNLVLLDQGFQPGVHVPPGVQLPIRRGTFKVSNRRQKYIYMLFIFKSLYISLTIVFEGHYTYIVNYICEKTW